MEGLPQDMRGPQRRGGLAYGLLLSHIASCYGAPRPPPLAFVCSHPMSRFASELPDHGGCMVGELSIHIEMGLDLMASPRDPSRQLPLCELCDSQSIRVVGSRDGAALSRSHVPDFSAGLRAAQWWLLRTPAPLPLAINVPPHCPAVSLPAVLHPHVCSLTLSAETLRRPRPSCNTEALEATAAAPLPPPWPPRPATPVVLQSMMEVRLEKCVESLNFKPLAATARNIRRLSLAGSGVTDITAITECMALEEVDLSYCVSLQEVTVLRHLPRLRVLSASWTGVEDLMCLSACPGLMGLDLSNCRFISNFAALGELRNLRRLVMKNTSVQSVEWIVGCVGLEEVDFTMCFQLVDLRPFSQLTRLHTVTVPNVGVTSIEWAPLCARLQRLNLDKCDRLRDLRPLARTKGLTYLSLAYSEEVEGEEGGGWLPQDVSTLREVVFSQCPQLSGLSILGAAERLVRLDISGTAVRTVAWVRQCRSLKDVNLSRCTRLLDYSPLAEVSHLERLNLSWSYVSDLGWLSGCLTHLRELRLSQCTRLTDPSPLRGAVQLQWLDLSGSAVRGIEWVPTCPSLTHLDLSRCLHLTQFAPVGKLAVLTTLNISYTRAAELAWVTTCCQLRVLDISRCALLQDASPLAELVHLHELIAVDCGIRDVAWVLKCPRLVSVDVSLCQHVNNLHEVGGVARWRAGGTLGGSSPAASGHLTQRTSLLPAAAAAAAAAGPVNLQPDLLTQPLPELQRSSSQTPSSGSRKKGRLFRRRRGKREENQRDQCTQM